MANLVNTSTWTCRLCLRSSSKIVASSRPAAPASLTAGLAAASRGRQFQQQEQQQHRFASSRAQSMRVKDRPALFLHQLNPSSEEYALSFLPEPPLFQSSPTVLGVNNGQNVTPRSFEENPDGRRMIHEILSNVYMQDAGLQTMAISRGEGFLHIIDERNPPALHRAGEPEDIIASVLCKDGKLVDGHYEEGYTYRLVTANGPIKLSDSLTQQIVKGMQMARVIEKQMQAEGEQK